MRDARESESSASAGELAIVPVHSSEDARRLIAVLDEVWGGAAHLDPGMVVALGHAGNYVVIAERDGVPVGGGVGFFGPPSEALLHSHIVGVLRTAAGGGVGYAVKQHQREWGLARGIRSITWTFDPLVSRNAHFNLTKLGVHVDAYLGDFYGSMDDGINTGQATDRLLVRWDITTGRREPGDRPARVNVTPWLVEDAEGEPTLLDDRPAGPRVSVSVPHDIEGLRERDPELARRWRSAVRDALGGAMAAGWRVVAFDRSGRYLLERSSA